MILPRPSARREVALTRAARSEGVPTVPSRWLLRLDTVCAPCGLGDALRPDEAVQARRRTDRSARRLPAIAPARAAPPLAARPRKLSVTQIETWLRDPYAIYARHILGLKALNELDADPGRAELGTAIHRTLDRDSSAASRRTLPRTPRSTCCRSAGSEFGPFLSRPGAWAFWWPRFTRIAGWLVAQERTRRFGIVEKLQRTRGKLDIGPARRTLYDHRQG